MWKPGSAPPDSGKKSPNNKQSKKSKAANSPLEGTGNMLSSPKESSSKSTTPKRLSGATMNMRFMKRKEETRQQEKDRERTRVSMDSSTTPADSSTPGIAPLTTSAASPLPQPTSPVVTSTGTNDRREHSGDAMEVDDEPITYSTSNSKYQVATPVDMYGMQAALIGRRSFGGFNSAMEEAWKESKASLEDHSDRPRKAKVSDEELIQRYQDIVKKRSDSSRPVGNLRDKAKTKRQRR